MPSRKDFELAASLVRECESIKRGPCDLWLVGERERDMLAHFLANFFAQTNSSFDRALFLHECGTSGHPEECPGCGNMPGEGINPDCNNSGGCGYWKSF